MKGVRERKDFRMTSLMGLFMAALFAGMFVLGWGSFAAAQDSTDSGGKLLPMNQDGVRPGPDVPNSPFVGIPPIEGGKLIAPANPRSSNYPFVPDKKEKIIPIPQPVPERELLQTREDMGETLDSFKQGLEDLKKPLDEIQVRNTLRDAAKQTGLKIDDSTQRTISQFAASYNYLKNHVSNPEQYLNQARNSLSKGDLEAFKSTLQALEKAESIIPTRAASDGLTLEEKRRLYEKALEKLDGKTSYPDRDQRLGDKLADVVLSEEQRLGRGLTEEEFELHIQWVKDDLMLEDYLRGRWKALGEQTYNKAKDFTLITDLQYEDVSWLRGLQVRIPGNSVLEEDFAESSNKLLIRRDMPRWLDKDDILRLAWIYENMHKIYWMDLAEFVQKNPQVAGLFTDRPYWTNVVAPKVALTEGFHTIVPFLQMGAEGSIQQTSTILRSASNITGTGTKTVRNPKPTSGGSREFTASAAGGIEVPHNSPTKYTIMKDGKLVLHDVPSSGQYGPGGIFSPGSERPGLPLWTQIGGGKGGKAPEYFMGTIDESNAIKNADYFLGGDPGGWNTVKDGVYLSKDGLRQVRITKHEGPSGDRLQHIHFEFYDKPHDQGGVVKTTLTQFVK